MKIFWLTVAGIAITVAAVLMWARDFNSAFVVAAIGLVAWFLNYRMQIKQQLEEQESVSSRAESEEIDEN